MSHINGIIHTVFDIFVIVLFHLAIMSWRFIHIVSFIRISFVFKAKNILLYVYTIFCLFIKRTELNERTVGAVNRVKRSYKGCWRTHWFNINGKKPLPLVWRGKEREILLPQLRESLESMKEKHRTQYRALPDHLKAKKKNNTCFSHLLISCCCLP